MKVRDAEAVLSKTEFNNQIDWETYPAADYSCNNCGQTISITLKDLNKHAYSDFSNLLDSDKENIDKTVLTYISIVPSSYLDFYCPTCKRPVSIYYDSWAGGHHTEAGHTVRYVVD